MEGDNPRGDHQPALAGERGHGEGAHRGHARNHHVVDDHQHPPRVERFAEEGPRLLDGGGSILVPPAEALGDAAQLPGKSRASIQALSSKSARASVATKCWTSDVLPTPPRPVATTQVTPPSARVCRSVASPVVRPTEEGHRHHRQRARPLEEGLRLVDARRQERPRRRPARGRRRALGGRALPWELGAARGPAFPGGLGVRRGPPGRAEVRRRAPRRPGGMRRGRGLHPRPRAHERARPRDAGHFRGGPRSADRGFGGVPIVTGAAGSGAAWAAPESGRRRAWSGTRARQSGPWHGRWGAAPSRPAGRGRRHPEATRRRRNGGHPRRGRGRR